LEENVASSIRPNRPDISDRFPVAGFTVRTGGPGYFEVAVATDPVLLLPEHRQERNDTNFFSTYASGPLPAETGEAVYLLPPGVMARFAGKDRMYYALATFADQSRSNPQIMHISPETAPSITISRSFTGRTRAIGIGNVRGGLTGSYTGKSGGSADWSGEPWRQGGEATRVRVQQAKLWPRHRQKQRLPSDMTTDSVAVPGTTVKRRGAPRALSMIPATTSPTPINWTST
jgi:hypothetical protein